MSATAAATHRGDPDGDAAASVVIDAPAVRAALRRCRPIVERHAAYLTRLDAVLGDGDHGDNLVIGFRAVDALLDELPATTPPGALLRAVGHHLVATVGGASGPLYGTAFLQAGAAIGDDTSVTADELAVMFAAAVDAVARRGRCAVGDKTILDTLAAASAAYRRELDAGRPPRAAFGSGVRHGASGMWSTRPLVARRGLAMRLGDRAVGHLDPGAVSCLLLLVAIGRG
jgi:dihydroxyacetone kinase-like protein